MAIPEGLITLRGQISRIKSKVKAMTVATGEYNICSVVLSSKILQFSDEFLHKPGYQSTSHDIIFVIIAFKANLL